MKQRKLIYFILGFASFSGVMVIYLVVKGDLATAAFNLVCLAINVWCLRVVYSLDVGQSEDVCGQVLNLRVNVLSDRMDTEHKYSSQLDRLTGERLSNLERLYHELEERIKPFKADDEWKNKADDEWRKKEQASTPPEHMTEKMIEDMSEAKELYKKITERIRNE